MNNIPPPENLVQKLSINGRTYEPKIGPSDTLLSVICYELDLIGTKQGCDKGDCGACTVLLDGQPVLSCLTLARCVDENEAITTIEGLCHQGVPDLLVQAFETCGALQCGFCQPGMILSAKALLAANQKPTLLEIKQALSGNLCRCTGYTKIYLAVLCASLVLSKEAPDLEHALEIVRTSRAHLGDQ